MGKRRREASATARIVFRCDRSLHGSIESIAARNGVNLSEAIRLMLAAYVGNDGGRSSDLTRLAKSLRPLSRVGGTTLRPRKALP
jgi:Ribbon-helix-helix protein, copG family